VTHRERIIAALEAWLDFFPWPETWTGELQRRSTSSGPAPFRRHVCDTCKGNGKLRGGWVCRDCKGLGIYEVDEYTGEPVMTFETPWEDLLRGVVRCSRCGGGSPQCSRCNGSGVEQALFGGRADMTGGAVAVGQHGKQGDRALDMLERGHQTRDRLDCYAVHLTPAMHDLRTVNRAAHFQVAWVHVWRMQPGGALLQQQSETLDRGLRFLETHVPEHEFRLPGDVYAASEARQRSLLAAKGKRAARPAQHARNQAIRSEHANGSTITSLASSYGLNKGQVSRIVNGRTSK
jgi:hypothetical protein